MYFAIVLSILTALTTVAVSLKTEPLEEYRVKTKGYV
jgi:hypothetical protein